MTRSSFSWSRLAPLAVTILAVCATSLMAGDIGGKVEKFTLPDVYGRDKSLSELADKQVVVVAFLGTECPLARLYGPRLQEMADEYAAKGVAFIGIDANSQDSLTDLLNFGRNYGVKFPLLKDRDGEVADMFGAVRNPEVFVLDKDRAIRYRGRVDDQYGLGDSSGYARPELKDRSLGKALDEVLASKPVSVTTTQVTGCIIGRKAKAEPKGEVTYNKHIAAIMDARCVECHREGQIGPFGLSNYEDVSGWGAMMKEVVNNGRMPPWSADPTHGKFGNDPRLSDSEKQLLYTWVDNGCPEGNAADRPKPREFAAGWRMQTPDQVLYMPKSFKVPAEGVINYQNFRVDPGWTEDKWILEAEVQPGAWGNVHHIICSIVPPGRTRTADEDGAEPAEAPRQNRRPQREAQVAENVEDGAEPAEAPRRRGRTGVRTTEGLDLQALRGGRVSAYIPGRNPTVCPPGTAIFAPAGSQISFAMHYTANGKEVEDISRIGIKFCEGKDVKYLSYTAGASAGDFAIPPYADNHKVESDVVFAKDTGLIVLHPHMHLRGKSMRYTAFYPNGTSEILLDVPKYDFNWQFEYELAEPKIMPAGTRMHVDAAFDNSENNAANPDPTKTIVWGPQSWDEMMIGYYTTITPLEDALAAKAKQEEARKAATKPAGEGQ